MDTSAIPEKIEEKARAEVSARERVRSALRVTAFAVCTGIAVLPPAILRLLTFGAEGPSARLGAHCCHAWGRAFCAIFGIRVTVRGKPPAGAFLVASNHVSYVDILVLASVYPAAYVAKMEIGRWPLFGWIARAAGTLFVDRKRPRDVVRAGEAMRKHLAAGISLTIFPEGGSGTGETVLPFLPSLLEPAAQAGIPCHAATLGYETVVPDTTPAKVVCWKGGIPFVPHIVNLARQPRILASVTFSDAPLVSSDRKELAQKLRERVQASFVPIRRV